MNKEKAPRYYPQGFISLTPDSPDGGMLETKKGRAFAQPKNPPGLTGVTM
ncbi:hypothetical protein LT278_002251 [Salmonella enterica]|nr:hypothetical protein [Salmonella enterica]EIP8377477.1 hypothetical protein [Salmonella enterica]